MYHLDQLVAFVTSVESGSFSAAARKIGKGHSTVSTAINNLEITLDAQLFDRSKKYPELTPIGEQIYTQAKMILRQNERLVSFASSRANFIEETLNIGLGSLIPFSYVEEELARLGDKFPHTTIVVTRDKAETLQKLAEVGDVDVAIQINRGAVVEVLDFVDLQPLKWECVCSPDSDLVDTDTVSVEAMLSTRQICCSAILENPLIRVRGEFALEIWQGTDQQDVVRMVENDMGWAFLPSLIVEERLAMGTLITFTPEYNPEHIPTTTAVDLLTQPGKEAGPALRYFIDLLLKKAQ